GADSEVSSITIYPKDFDSKAKITAYLDQYNEGKDKADQVIYTDLAAMVTSAIGTMVDVTSTVLIVFASISLVVSSVMIGIIIYVSVVERTKEIGTLRSLGARKKDVSRLFIMESVTIGFLAGAIGVLFTYVLSVPINLILNHVFSEYDLGSIALLNPAHALILIIVSMVLTYIAGLIPSALAGKKDPVLCLRSE
ncbi:MAG TPA: sulfate ABC transporter ATP-binding protein, partial [Firmicutes bacterium]|nr:sulfate ABC transporter ATP-binding protein [Bacillota bacterium]